MKINKNCQLHEYLNDVDDDFLLYGLLLVIIKT